MISALLSWFLPTRMFEPTSTEWAFALLQTGYRGTFRPWLLSDEYMISCNHDIQRRGAVDGLKSRQ